MMIMATDLYDTVMHRVVTAEQRKHGLIDDQIEAEYFKGIEHTLTPESDQADDERTMRLLTILDALVFYGTGDHLAEYEAQLTKLYPVATQAAVAMYENWSPSRSIRRLTCVATSSSCLSCLMSR